MHRLFVFSIVVCSLIVTAGSILTGEEPDQAKAPRSVETLQVEIDGLKVETVAWRKIAWKTCLLEGLKESREKKKPLILWIFIDRPIDDERC